MKKLPLLVMMIIFAATACKRDNSSSNANPERRKIITEKSLIYQDIDWRAAGEMIISTEGSQTEGPRHPALYQISALSRKYLNATNASKKYADKEEEQISSSDQIRFINSSADDVIYVVNGQVYYVYEKENVVMEDHRKNE